MTTNFAGWNKNSYYRRNDSIEKCDANEIIEEGVYRIAARSTNFPLQVPNNGASTEGFLTVENWGKKYVTQTFLSMWGTTQYVRSNKGQYDENGKPIWTEWQELLTNAVEEIELSLLEGFLLNSGFVSKNSAGEVTINALIVKAEGSFETNSFIPIAQMPVGFRPRMEIFGQANFQRSNSVEGKRTIYIGCASINNRGVIYIDLQQEDMTRACINLSYKAV